MHARSWTLAKALLSVALASTLILYHGTVASFIRIWRGSETFTHGFLIVPISGYLVWLKREEIATLTPRPYPLALLLLPMLGMAWLVARATSTALVEQISFIAFIPVLVWVLLGLRVSKSVAFPLGFLFFCVPFGDIFRPPLMNITANLAVRALRLSGVPVAMEGVFLATPVAQWRVAEACSGLSFLVSGLALASLFAYMTYRKTWKRIACVVLSVAVLILANGLRVYLLILVGYLSDMRVGRGFEHYAFGWILYVLVMVAYLAAGAVFRDPAPAVSGSDERSRDALAPARTGPWIAVTATAVLLLVPWPGLYARLSPHPEQPGIAISWPPPRAGWTIASAAPTAWKPNFSGATSEAIQTYVKGGATVQCYVAFYAHQREGSELIQFRNVIARTDDTRWRNAGDHDRRIRLERGSLDVRETDVRGLGERYLVWDWYWIPDQFTTNPGWAKLLEARASLLLRRDHAAAVVLSASEADGQDATVALRQFVEDMLPSIRFALHQSDIGP